MSKVNLVAYTTQNPEHFDDDKKLLELIEYIAKVSNPAAQDVKTNLIKYLVDNKHWSPFEMVSATLEINTTRDIARQILRHRSFSFQEFSQRYADPTKALGFTVRQARLQDTKNRQNSIITDDDELIEKWNEKQEEIIEHVKAVYAWAIRNGIAKEQARSVLPEGNTESRLYMAGTIRSWCHYIELRTKPGTQREHMIIAQQCANALAPVFPMISEFVYKEQES